MDGQKNIELLNKNYFSVRREILYNILFQFRIDTKVVRRKKNCLTETCSSLRVGKNCVTCLQLKWSEKKEMIYRHCFQA